MTKTRFSKLLLVGTALALTVGALAVSAQEEKSATPPVRLSHEEKVEARTLMQVLKREMSHTTLQRRNSRYVLHPGDIIEINFPLIPAFNQVETVQPDGYISLQNLGDLHAAGKTVPELTEALKEKYTKIMRDPKITVVLKDFEHPYFIASGEVTKPGKYELRGMTTVAQAVAVAGGFSKLAKRSHVLLFRRVSDDYVNIKRLDLKKMLDHGNLQEDVELQSGDLLFVPKSGTASVLNALFPHTSTGLYFPFRP